MNYPTPKYPWIDSYFLAKPGCEKDYKEEWEAYRYLLRGKMVAMQGHDNKKRDILSVKLEPEIGLMLREQYADIFPGYYMNKVHWNSIDLNGSVPDDVLRGMIDDSYRLIFSSLPKKTQRDITET